jgi:hypothetical protein
MVLSTKAAITPLIIIGLPHLFISPALLQRGKKRRKKGRICRLAATAQNSASDPATATPEESAG